MKLLDSVLVESKTARDQGLSAIDTQESQLRLLSKIKSLMFALWRGGNVLTTHQVADYYEVPEGTIRQNYLRCKAEFDADGVEKLTGQALQDARYILSLPSKTSQVILYSSRAVIRMGFILQDSPVAGEVRTAALNVLQGVGSLISSKEVLCNLICANPPYSSLISGTELKVSSPLSPHYDSIAKSLKSTYKDGAIRGLKKDRIRERLSALSTYTQTWKLNTQQEVKYNLKTPRMKYPDLMSDLIQIKVDGELKSALFLFQIEDFLVEPEHFEGFVGRQYARHIKNHFGADYVYQFLVAPFGATPDAEVYVRDYLPPEEKGFVGVVTVKELASFLRDQAWKERSRGLVKGEINTQFKEILDYKVPDAPLAVLLGLSFGS